MMPVTPAPSAEIAAWAAEQLMLCVRDRDAVTRDAGCLLAHTWNQRGPQDSVFRRPDAGGPDLSRPRAVTDLRGEKGATRMAWGEQGGSPEAGQGGLQR